MLLTDWSKPGTSVLQRLHDGRVRQYWDGNHMLAAVLKKAETGKLHPDCCERNGFLWDMAAAYSPGAQWRETLPTPILFDGPVVHTVAGLEAVLTR